MFDRRRLPMLLCILLCAALAAGFIPYSMGLLPILQNLYFDGWWTLLLIFPALTKFVQDGYSRPALAVLASGLLLFANALGKIPAGMLPASVVYTALASTAGGTVIELTGRHLKKKAALPGRQPEKLEEGKSPFAREESSETKTSAAESAYIPKRAPSNTAQTQKGWTPDSAAGGSNYRPAEKAASAASKGWDPGKTYTQPGKGTSMRTASSKEVQKSRQTSFHPAVLGSDSFPLSIAVFSDSKTNSNNQNLTGGLVFSLFGNARLSLREADYSEPITVTMISIFGDARLETPYVSNLSISSIPILGDCKDKRKLVNSSAMPSLSVRCISVLGSCSIH